SVPTLRPACPPHRRGPVHLAMWLGFPTVAKNTAAFTRLRTPVVPGTTIVSSERELLDRFATRGDLSGVLLQEYIPHEDTEDWFVHAYCDASSAAVVGFAGRKAYAWPRVAASRPTRAQRATRCSWS